MIEPKISIQDLITMVKPIAIETLKSNIKEKLDNFIIVRVQVDIACTGNPEDEIKSNDVYFSEIEPDLYTVSVNPYWGDDCVFPAAFIRFWFRKRKGLKRVKDTEAVEQ